MGKTVGFPLQIMTFFFSGLWAILHPTPSNIRFFLSIRSGSSHDLQTQKEGLFCSYAWRQTRESFQNEAGPHCLCGWGQKGNTGWFSSLTLVVWPTGGDLYPGRLPSCSPKLGGIRRSGC